jgi:hypothetical protein
MSYEYVDKKGIRDYGLQHGSETYHLNFTKCKIPKLESYAGHVTSDCEKTQQYIPEDNSEHHTRRRENLKSHMSHDCPVSGSVVCIFQLLGSTVRVRYLNG